MKKLRQVFALLFVVTMLVLCVPVSASAATNPYPMYQDADGDGYQEVRCTYYAWKQAYDRLGVALPGGWGDGGSWLTSAKNAKYDTGTVAKANSIAVWQNGSWGHVAFVTSVNGNTMTINEGGNTYNDGLFTWLENGVYKTKKTTDTDGIRTGASVSSKYGSCYDKQYSADLILKGFIYLDGSSSSTKILTLNFHVNGGKISSDTYKSSSSYVCTSDGSKFGPKYYYNQYIDADYGLYNASSFGLTRTGYKFVGWSTSKSGGTILKEDDTTLRTSDITSKIKDGSCTVTLYAQWKPNTLTIKYHTNGGSIDSTTYSASSGKIYKNGSQHTKTYSYNNVLHENGLTNASTFGLYKTGYTFTGWSTSKSGGTVFDQNDGTLKPTDITSKIKTGDATVTMYAQWEPNTLTTYYHVNGGSLSSDTYKVVNGYICTSDGEKHDPWYSYNGTALSKYGLYSPKTFGLKRAGYTFVGWSTSKSGETILDETDLTITPTDITSKIKDGDCSVTLYAQWKKQNVATITKQPQTAYAQLGEKVTTTVKATGDGLTYTWYVKDPGDTKYYKSSITSPTYSVKMTEAKNGRRAICYVTDKYGNKVQSKTVVLRMSATITEQPKTAYAQYGKTIKASVSAVGDGLTYQWYVKNAGSDKYIKSSVTGPVYSYKMDEARSDRRVLCYVTDKYGNRVRTEAVVLRMSTTILDQTTSVCVANGKKATVKIDAVGDDLTYRWCFKNEGASKYTYTSSFTGDTYSVTMSDARANRRVLCKVSDKYGNVVKSETVVLKQK